MARSLGLENLMDMDDIAEIPDVAPEKPVQREQKAPPAPSKKKKGEGKPSVSPRREHAGKLPEQTIGVFMLKAKKTELTTMSKRERRSLGGMVSVMLLEFNNKKPDTFDIPAQPVTENDGTRTTLTISNEAVSDFQLLCKTERRSYGDMITILMDHYKSLAAK